MSALIDVLLVLIAVGALIALGLATLVYRESEPTDDFPYQAGLDASARVSALAFEAERLMFVAAEEAKQREGEA
jgi:hypothetical protein